MFDPTGGRGRGPRTRGEWWFSVGFVLVLVGLLAAELLHEFEPVKLSALLVVLFWAPLLVAHEAGHALAAALLGWRVRRVVLGMGRPLGGFRVGSVPVEVRLVPVEGFVEAAPVAGRARRLAAALIYFAGPAADLLAGAAAVLALERPSPLGGPGRLAWQCLAIAAFAQAFFNLVPHAVFTPRGPIANDGLGILRSLFGPAAPAPDPYNEPVPTADADERADAWKRRGPHGEDQP